MKIYGSVLALSAVLNPAWTTSSRSRSSVNAFIIPTATTRHHVQQHGSSSTTTSLAVGGYLDNLGKRNPGEASAAEQAAPPLPGEGYPDSYYNDDSGPTLPFEDETATLIQGNSLRTWALPREEIERIKLSLKTEGRPLTSNIELWQGPDYTPMKLKVYVEDGCLRPFNAVIETPMDSNTIAIYNTGNMEFPFYANVEEYTRRSQGGLSMAPRELADYTVPRTVQGGAITSFPFPAEVESVQFLLKTDGRNLKARVELMQGPNNDKQVMEFYSSDGYKRHFFAIIETPGSGNVVRIINQNTMEFPFSCYIAPYVIGAVTQDNSFMVD